MITALRIAGACLALAPFGAWVGWLLLELCRSAVKWLATDTRWWGL
jgi:hypothetical protein